MRAVSRHLARRVERGLATALGLVAAASVALAAELDIAGDYGNPAGCGNLATGDYSDDSMLWLTPKAVATYVTHCSFLQVLRTENGAHVVTVICGHEGDEAQTLGMMRFERAADGVDAYDVFDSYGEHWGRTDACP